MIAHTYIGNQDILVHADYEEAEPQTRHHPGCQESAFAYKFTLPTSKGEVTAEPGMPLFEVVTSMLGGMEEIETLILEYAHDMSDRIREESFEIESEMRRYGSSLMDDLDALRKAAV